MTPMPYSIEMTSELAMLPYVMLKHLYTCVDLVTLRTVPTTCDLLHGFLCATTSGK